MSDPLSAGVSVVLCCYNSASRIIPVLEHLAYQQLSSASYEVILVDNNCTDDTVSIARKYWDQQNIDMPLYIVSEKKAGLSYARQSGIQKARNSVIVFCDDDNLLDSDYLQKAFDTMQLDLRIGAVGGVGVAIVSGLIPEWFNTYQGAYACGPQGVCSGYVTRTRGYLYGAGLCIRTEIIRSILNSKSIKLSDRKGKSLVSGGDSEICMLISLSGYELYYNAEMKFKHLIGQNRLTLKYLHKLYESFGVSYLHLHTLEKQLGIGNHKNKTAFALIRSSWHKDFPNVLRYLIKGPVFSGTVNSAWIWGLTKTFFLKDAKKLISHIFKL